MEMEKALLIIQKTKKGKLIARLKLLDSNKELPIQGFYPQNADMNEMQVEVQRDKGQPVLIKLGGKIIFDPKNLMKKSNPKDPYSETDEKAKKRIETVDRKAEINTESKIQSSKNDEELITDHIDYVQSTSYAPYNFVPLNKEVVKVEIDKNKQTPSGLTFDAYHTDFNTGWIDVEIETVTPIYIRGIKDESEIQQNNNQTPDFYKYSDKPAIPGSSLRGMIRQMIEIVSYGKFGFFDSQKTLYYRGLADRSSLRNEYQNRMSSYDRNRKINLYNVSAGILKKEGLSYLIMPTEYDRITKSEAKKLVTDYKEFEFYDLPDSSKYRDYYLVVSGDMKNKKHDWLIKKATSESKADEILDLDIQNYNNDKTRKILTDKKGNEIPSILNLIELLDKNIYEEVPCFYVKCKDKKYKEKERFSFGHTAMFRLAYEKSIGDHVPDELTDPESYDIAGVIFGNEHNFAGRVFFEDALIDKQYDDKNIFLGKKHPKILSGPKPTTFQHYLVQVEDNLKSLKHYNSNSSIRGNKVYWHKKGDDWEETNTDNIKNYPKQYTQINPIKPGVKFSGRIRFENLSDIELGALVFSLNLPDGCCHKIGMGKSLGLGSIKITPTLYLSNRMHRYQDLFAEWDNKISTASSLEAFTKPFEQHILHKIGENQIGSLWRTKRLKEFFITLHYDAGLKLEKQNKVNYMDIQHFRNRSILPMPSQLMNPEDLIQDRINKKIPTEQAYGKTKISVKDVTNLVEPPKFIKKIEIDSLWDTYHVEWELNEDVNILIGLNGSGKSTVLRFIYHLLRQERFARDSYAKLANMIKITFDNGEETYHGLYKITQFKLDKLLSLYLKNNEISNKLKALTILENKEFVDKYIFLDEVKKICGSKWVNENKDELIEAFYYTGTYSQKTPMADSLFVVLIVTFDRHMGKDEIEKIEENKSILDFDLNDSLIEFKKETERQKIDENSDKIKLLSKIINDLFEDTGKKTQFNKEKGLIFSKNDELIDILDLSSGEKQLIYILIKVFLGSIQQKPVILLLDEPEISLHVGWQLNFINHIRKLNQNMQIVIASHSFAITMEGWYGIETHMHTIMRLKTE